MDRVSGQAKPPRAADSCDMASLLANAMKSRTVHIHGQDESDSDEEFDDEEWSD